MSWGNSVEYRIAYFREKNKCSVFSYILDFEPSKQSCYIITIKGATAHKVVDQ